MPATTSALIALRLSGRLMVIQNACPRFSRITLLVSVIVPLACLPWIGKYLRQDGSGLQAGIRGRSPDRGRDKTPRIREAKPRRRSSGFRTRRSPVIAAIQG